jgi:hypothetical protein
MAEEIFSLEPAIPQIGELLHRLAARPAALDDPAKSAVRAVWRAVDRTRMHLAAIRAGRAARQDPSPDLAELWSDAALAIADVDPELPNACA